MSIDSVHTLPPTTEYLCATRITSNKSKTRLYVKTILHSPEEKRIFTEKLPIESVLLYHYKTPLANINPVKLPDIQLNNVNLGSLNKSNTEDPNINALSNFKDRLCFSFTSKGNSQIPDDWTIQLPKLVLARDLFFSHPSLLRLAFFNTNLTTDMTVDKNAPEAFHIFIAANRKITSLDLKDPIFLKRLALILLCPELSQSFLSIHQKTFKGKNIDKNKVYDFDIDAPCISNIQLNVEGRYYQDKKIFRIERINSFESLETNINKPIKIHIQTQKALRNTKKIFKQKYPAQEKEILDNSQLDLEANADIDQKIVELRNKVSTIYTTEELNISLKASCREVNITKRYSNEKKYKIEGSVAGGEGDTLGNAPGFTVNSKEEPHKKDFISLEFKKLLEEIENEGYKTHRIHHNSFNFENNTSYKMKAKHQNRGFYVSLVCDKKNKEQFYLCEIDTTDLKKNISTLLLPYNSKTEKLLSKENIIRFKIAILLNPLSWPKDFLTEVHNIQLYTTINHPSKQSDPPTNQKYKDWATRIIEKWQSQIND